MKIALIGYGRMGHEIEEIAVKRGHTIQLIIDLDNKSDLNPQKLKGIDVAIEFSTPETAFENVSACLNSRVPVVCGTTGWQKDYEQACVLCSKNRTSFIHSSNFSIGVNLLFMLNEELAKQMNRFDEYVVDIEEIHHTKKLDSPSGTAISLANGIRNSHQAYSGWCFNDKPEDGKVPIKCIREGTVPGTHTIRWDSSIDSIVLKHEAKNRKGLAFGAVVAAEFIKGRSGVFTMKDVMGL